MRMKNALFSPLFRPHQPRARPFSFPVILLPFSFSLPSLGSRPLLLLLEPKNCIFVVCFAPPKSVLVGTERKEIGVGSVEVLGGKNEFKGRQIVVKNQSSSDGWNPKGHSHCSIHASNCLPRAMKWWEKSIIPNMTEITSSDHLVESLATAGDKLVIVDFYSPGCGGCKALHPKICQLAESYPDAIFLKVNYEEHKSMCHSLRIHVLPFFRLYRGAQGRVCSFSCTNATVKKLKDAMAKHGTERCSLGPAKGLEEEELLVLASNGGARFNRPPALSSI
nr:PREDICTED: thioredoxin-like 1-2, chloroplastic [Musa acuminata subsp. malaccensis]